MLSGQVFRCAKCLIVVRGALWQNPGHDPYTSKGALSGVRILDMATVLAAPFGATLCADHGADVVKLELPDGSDPLRGLQPVKDGVGCGSRWPTAASAACRWTCASRAGANCC
jgi:crotonobetainyl-CoA:carnitine CoA-transferase CaiB-like acyl-CoA transferase